MGFLRCEDTRDGKIAVINRCDACGREFQFGPHIYNGTAIQELGWTVCKACGPASKSTADYIEALDRLRTLSRHRSPSGAG